MNHEQITAILTACLERGFELPLCLCVVGVNGAVLAVRYALKEDAGMDCEVLAQHVPEPVFLLPINMMITDAQGEAARVVIAQQEGWHFADLN